MEVDVEKGRNELLLYYAFDGWDSVGRASVLLGLMTILFLWRTAPAA